MLVVVVESLDLVRIKVSEGGGCVRNRGTQDHGR